MGKYSERLAQSQENFERGRAQYGQRFGGERVPEGTYIAQLQSARIIESGEKKDLSVVREHLILEGEEKGKVATDFLRITGDNSEFGLVMVQRWVEMLEWEYPENAEDLEDLIDSLAKEASTVKIKVSYGGANKAFTNVDVLELIEAGSAETEGDDEPEGEPEGDDEALIESLKAIADARGIELESEDLEGIVKELSEYTWNEEEDGLDEDEVTALTEAGIMEGDDEPEGEPEGDDEPSNDDDEETVEACRVFCQTFGLEFTDDDDLESLKETIAGNRYDEEVLDKDEKELLETLELTDNIDVPAPKKAKKGGKKKGKK